MIRRGLLPALALLGALGACTEQMTAPGVCPTFCPGSTIQITDTIFTDVIVRDSAFGPYIETHQSEALAVADLPGIVDSRAIFLMNRMFTRVAPDAADTLTVPIAVDSSWLRIAIERRDTNAANLWVKTYRLPLSLDSNTTFDSVAAAFAAPSLDSVNLDSLLARPDVTDSVTLATWGDTIRTDGAGHVLQFSPLDSTLILSFVLDTIRAPFVEADSGQLAFGVRVSADSLASIALGSNEGSGRDALLRRFYRYQKMVDSTTDSTVHAFADRQALFDSFVFDPPTSALDSNLAVGGAPSTRSLLRVNMPSVLRDTTDIVRATLILVPVAPVPGAPGDSFTVLARPVVTDLGAKSPLADNSALWGAAAVRLNIADTLRIELTNLVRVWALDTTAATALVLGQIPEAATYAQIRFYSSRTPAFRPALHITYVRRFPFGAP